MIVVVDYGMGNLGSITNMLKKAGAQAVVSSTPDVIARADKLILPGVGAFDSGMANLEERGLVSLLQRVVVEQKKPLLGICLGMQLFTQRSEEGSRRGLGWIDADTMRFDLGANSDRLKIPHMGWNTVHVEKESPLFHDPDRPELRFYFVHSYHVVCRDPSDILTTTRYGHDFVSSVQHGNIIGVQFHPEKSHRFGMNLLRNFALQ